MPAFSATEDGERNRQGNPGARRNQAYELLRECRKNLYEPRFVLTAAHRANRLEHGLTDRYR